jgi:hypothetical protein
MFFNCQYIEIDNFYLNVLGNVPEARGEMVHRWAAIGGAMNPDGAR